jgi:hypothetical protein
MATPTIIELSKALAYIGGTAGTKSYPSDATSYETVPLDIFHELSDDFSALTVERKVLVRAGRRKDTLIKVRSQVVPTLPQRLRSPAYLGARRRALSKQLRAEVDRVELQVDREDFYVATYPIFDLIDTALRELQTATTEGNSREILRQIRDSLIDCGWEKYKAREARNAVREVLALLERLEVVEAQDARFSYGVLRDAGLTPMNFGKMEPHDGDIEYDEESGTNETIGGAETGQASDKDDGSGNDTQKKAKMCN